MNVTRIAILGVALIAAIVAAMLVRGMLGGGTTASQASVQAATGATEILVAAKEIVPGHALDAESVRWEAWPKATVTTGFITKETQPDIAKAIEGIVVRAPLVTGQPITDASIVRAGAAGFLAATIKPGRRGVGVTVNPQTSAGGFILPNDHVDVIVTRDMSDGNGPKIFRTFTILRDVRVLAVDQTAHPEKDQQSVVAKTATLELTQDQSELLNLAEQTGVVSLTLRALGDSVGEPTGENPFQPRQEAEKEKPVVVAQPGPQRPAAERTTSVTVFRYGVVRGAKSGPGAAPAASPAFSFDTPSVPAPAIPNLDISIAPVASITP